MLLIQKTEKNGVSAILLFGKGLIGSAISTELDKYDYLEKVHLKFGWKNESEIENQLTDIFSKFIKIKIKLQSLTIIWSAGKAGFSATKAQTDAELTFFKSSLDIFSKFCIKFSLQNITSFILFSSAGGLHESQTNVIDQNNIVQKRPYSILKKNQEDCLLVYRKVFNRNIILRVSTVYPISNFSGRLGLIAILFLNSSKNRLSQFYGSEKTLRDYISDEDIGKYIVKLIESNNIDLPEINYLISGKPTSIFEIKNMIEKIINRKIFVQYKLEVTNSENISFSPSLGSKGLEVSNLYTNLCRIHQNMFY